MLNNRQRASPGGFFAPRLCWIKVDAALRIGLDPARIGQLYAL